MKKTTICILVLSIIFGLGTNSYGYIILSGDGNLTDDLVSGTYGNRQFFSNVLGAGTNVLVLEEIGWGGAQLFDTQINDYYNSLSGVSSSLHSGTITAGDLAFINLFVAPTPDDAFTASELSVLKAFNLSGGSIFFLGENREWDATSNQYINDALTYLGSGMSIIYDTWIDPGYNIASGDKIISDSLTAGVSQFQYGCTSQISGGTTLFLGTQYEKFVAYEVGSPVIPAPAAILLGGIGVSLVGWMRRKRAI